MLQNAEIGIAQEEQVLARDIQRSLQALGDLISEKLSPAAELSGKAQHSLLVKRWREILFDVTSDFNKTTTTLARKRDYSELLQNASSQNQNAENTSDMDHLLRERNSIQNSMSTSASIIAQASDTYSDLRQQGASLKGVGGSISRITQAVPSLNRVVESIRRKKSRDDYIVAGVIATCIVFTLWYVFG